MNLVYIVGSFRSFFFFIGLLVMCCKLFSLWGRRKMCARSAHNLVFFSPIPNVHLVKDLGWEINLRFWLSKMKVLM